ncbi:MAG: heavy-metal-associated domain-containing protein [Clostridia bacterium]|nr:heavy-metal-associated domain-containing protein [Clostridia bacterium]
MANVEGALSGLDGVKQAKAELSGKTTVVYDPAKVTLEQMKKAINDAGYKVKE